MTIGSLRGWRSRRTHAQHCECRCRRSEPKLRSLPIKRMISLFRPFVDHPIAWHFRHRNRQCEKFATHQHQIHGGSHICSCAGRSSGLSARLLRSVSCPGSRSPGWRGARCVSVFRRSKVAVEQVEHRGNPKPVRVRSIAPARIAHGKSRCLLSIRSQVRILLQRHQPAAEPCIGHRARASVAVRPFCRKASRPFQTPRDRLCAGADTARADVGFAVRLPYASTAPGWVRPPSWQAQAQARRSPGKPRPAPVSSE